MVRLVAVYGFVASIGLSAVSSAWAGRPRAAPPTASAALSAMVALPGNVHPLARPDFDVGRLDPGMKLSGLSLLFRMSPDQAALEKHALAAQQDPASPSYHRWISPEQYATAFGARAADVERAAGWLASQGLSVDGPSRSATRLGFSGTVAQLERAFRTEMRRYRVSGEDHFAMSAAPSVPADLAPSVLGIHGLHDFRLRSPSHDLQPQYALTPSGPDAAARVPVLAPADFAKIYDVESLHSAGLTGAGQVIAVVGGSDFNDQDIAAFRTLFSLPAATPTRVLVPNTGAAAVNGDLVEADLDLEWAGALAPDAAVVFVFTGQSPNLGAIEALFYAIEERVAPVVSMSLGSCETVFTSADASFVQAYGAMAALEGTTVLVATGDTGAAACDAQTSLAAYYGEAVSFPASVPEFLAVGGTEFEITRSNTSTYLNGQLDALSYIPESAWNDTSRDIDAGNGGLGAGGGGASRLFAKPYWQVPYTPNDGARDLPDVAMSASAYQLPYALTFSYTAADGDAEAPEPESLTATAGTSAATPSLAGVFALLNQAVAEASPGAAVTGLGNVSPVLYALANSAASAGAFHDVTTGNNVVPCAPTFPDCPSTPPYQFGYAAGPGYDRATGLGSIDAAKLVAAWKALAPTSTSLNVSASGRAAGSPLELTATVASQATSGAMTGSVTFYYIGAGADGGPGFSGTLGVTQVTASTTSATQGATASLSAQSPGGLAGSGARIGAFYGGDLHYLASWSATSPLSGTSTLAICPTAVTLATQQSGFQFETSGGSPPIRWGIHDDGTCARGGSQIVCSSIDGGVFVAGPTSGTATIVAVDQDDTYVTSIVTLVDAGADGAVPPLPTITCPPPDDDASAAPPATEGDATVAQGGSEAGVALDAGESDGAVARSSSHSGCSCVTAGVPARGNVGYGPGAALFALALGARRLVGRRRGRRRGNALSL
jgi:hypothetical protein